MSQRASTPSSPTLPLFRGSHPGNVPSVTSTQAVSLEVMEGRSNAADALPSPPRHPLPPSLPKQAVSPAHSPLPTPPPPSSPLAPPPTPSLVPGATICEFISGPVAPAQLSHRISHAQTVNDNSVGAHHISEFSTILLLQVHAARRARRPIPPCSCSENRRETSECICSSAVVDLKRHFCIFFVTIMQFYHMQKKQLLAAIKSVVA